MGEDGVLLNSYPEFRDGLRKWLQKYKLTYLSLFSPIVKVFQLPVIFLKKVGCLKSRMIRHLTGVIERIGMDNRGLIDVINMPARLLSPAGIGHE